MAQRRREPAGARLATRRPRSPTGWPRPSSASGSQLVVGLDPRRRPAAGRASRRRAPRPRARRRGRRALLPRDRRRGRRRTSSAVKPQLAFFEALGADGLGAFEDVCALRARRAGLLVIADAKRGDIGSTARAYAAAYLEPAARAACPARRRADRQPVPRPRLARAVPARLPARRGRPLLPRQDVERGRSGGPGPRALRRAAALARRWRGSCDEWGEDARRRARALERRRRRRRDPSAGGRRGAAADAAGRSCSSRASGRRARRRPTSRGRSRAGRRARSSPSRARSSTRSGSREPTGGRRPGPRPRGSRARSGPSPAGRRCRASVRRWVARLVAPVGAPRARRRSRCCSSAPRSSAATTSARRRP